MPELILLLLLLAIILYVVSTIISDLFGAPYVPTSSKLVDSILKNANLKPGQCFVELGCGDGRLVRNAVAKYYVSGLGIDINPYLIFYAKIMAHFQQLKNIKFKISDLRRTDLSQADVIFLYLLPSILPVVQKKLMTQPHKKILVISHFFQLSGWEKYLLKTITISSHPIHYYQLF